MVAIAALAFAGAGAAANPPASLPTGWSHAAVNVVGPKGRGHTVVYDRGRVTAVGPQTLTLKELDALVTIAVAANATVMVNGLPGTLSEVQPGYSATTTATDGAPASDVRATSPLQASVTTKGKVIAVGVSSLTLRELGGTVVTISIAPTATVKVNGRIGALAEIRRGFTATTVAAGGQPASEVRSTGGKLNSTRNSTP